MAHLLLGKGRMRRAVTWVFLSLFVLCASAKPLPLTAKDVSLMLRGGYSSPSVMRELSSRHFADTVDAAKETMLVQAGATPDLLNALKAGTYSVSAEEIARAREELAAQAKRKALEAEQARKFDTLHQAQEARDRAAAQAQGPTADAIYKFLKTDLVRCHNGSLVRADEEALAHKKLFAFYFSAHWCQPCRKFTPQLVEYYNRVVAQHPEFEIIFYSFDKSGSAMETYMRETNMPWPAIEYGKLQEKEVLKKNAGNGIPSLVLVDATGRVLSSSYAGTQYLGPAKVLSDLDAILAGNGAPQVAAGR
jgi:thiol-disulfide isomerase/thioredoxin